jgi:hypothetical protein
MASNAGDGVLSAGTIVGLLADSDRRRCFAAVELGARSRDAVVDATGLTAAQVGKALGRLVSGGLVISGPDGVLIIAVPALRAAAREALSRPDSGEHDGAPEDVRRVLRNFVVDGRISQIPTSTAKRRVLLDWLVQDFEPGVHYTEQMVNLILGKRHQDTAALRRYLVDEGLLDRARGEYWRSGGAVEA